MAQGAPTSAEARMRAALVVVGATMGMALGSGARTLISVLMRPLEADLGWSRAEINMAPRSPGSSIWKS
jgi:hypothetical protein